jgi:hypothetical protein
MKTLYPLLVAMTFFASCGVRISYLGSSLAPTKHVDVYVEASAIKKPYTIIGKGYPANFAYGALINTPGKLQKKVVETARKKGADAVLFQDFYLQERGTNFYSATRTDSAGNGVIATTSGALGPVITAGRNIYFLRYN